MGKIILNIKFRVRIGCFIFIIIYKNVVNKWLLILIVNDIVGM